MARFRPILSPLDDRLVPASGLDPTFGVGGVARVNTPVPGNYPYAVEEALPDGSLLVAAMAAGGGLQLTKLTPAGGLDPAYGTAGRSAVLDAGATLYVQAIAAAPDGGVSVLANRIDPDPNGYGVGRPVLYRLAADGSVAAGFPAAGVAVPELPPAQYPVGGPVFTTWGGGGWAGGPASLAVRADGSVAVGQANAGGASVLVFTPAGELDTGFGDGGRATLSDPVPYWSAAPALVPAADNGLILVRGTATGLVASRLTAAGAVDPTFGSGGVAVLSTATPGFMIQSYTAVATADGGLLVGWADDTRPTVRKLTAAGTPDATFGTGGTAELPLLPPETDIGIGWCGVGLPSPGLTLAVRPGGGILAVTTRKDRTAVLDLLTPNGAADPAFAGDGRFLLRHFLGDGQSAGEAVPLADGRVAVLVTTSGNDGTGQDVAVLTTYADPADPEYVPPPEPPAELDPGFDGDGVVDLRPVNRYDPDAVPTFVYYDSPGVSIPVYQSRPYPSVSKVLALADGGTLVVGKLTEPDGRYGLFVERLLADGSPDPAFGVNGRAYLDTAGQVGKNLYQVSDAAVTPDGGVVLVANTPAYAGQPDGFPGLVRVFKLTAAGAVDKAFLANANAAGGFDGAGSGTVEAVLVQPDGRILVGGSVGQAAVLRLHPDGTLDTTFGDGGRAVIDGDPGRGTSVAALTLDAAGRLLVAGGYNTGAGYGYGWCATSAIMAGCDVTAQGRPFVARLTADGVLDAGFGGGVVSLDGLSGDGSNRTARWVGAAADSGVVVGLKSRSDAVRLVRLTAAGTVDAGYGRAGVVEVYDGRGFLGLTFGRDGAAVLATGLGYLYGERIGLYQIAADGALGSLGGLPVPETTAGRRYSGVTSGGVAIAADGRVVVGFAWDTEADGRIILERNGAGSGLYLPAGWDVPPVPQPDPRPDPEAWQAVPVAVSVARPPVPVARPLATPTPATPATPAVVVKTDGPRVWLEEAGTGRVLLPAFAPFEASYTGTLNAVLADLDGDGVSELVVSPADGGGPVVAVFRRDGTEVNRFWGIEDAGFRGGVRLAVGDVNADGTADLVVTPGLGGGPRVAVYDGRSVLGRVRRLVNDFFAFEDSQRGGAVAAFVDGKLVFAAGPGGGPRVRTVDARSLLAAAPTKLDDLPLEQDRFIGDPADRGGVTLVLRPEAGQVLAAAGANKPVPVAGRVMSANDPLTLPGVWVG